MSPRERHGSRAEDRPAELMRLATKSLRSNWLPNVFAAVFDVIAFNSGGMRFHGLSREHRVALGAFEQAHVGKLRRCQNRRLGSIPAAFKRFLMGALSRYASEASDEAGRDLMFVLHAIDKVFWGVAANARNADFWSYTGMYRAFLEERGTLLDNGTGYLLPRVGRAAEPARTECDFFSALCRVRAHDGCELRYLQFNQLNPDVDTPRATGLRSMLVGVLAAVQHHDELSWMVNEARGTYSVSMKPEAEAAVIQRTLAGLEWLAKRGAEIVLLPELVSSNGLHERIAKWLQAREAAKPRLVITGTFLQPDPEKGGVRNRAHAIDCDGGVLWSQDKMHQYKFTAEHQREASCKLASKDLIEDIDVSNRCLVIVDSPLGERIAILICEDFARTVPQKQLLVEAGANVLLVPVMASAKEDPPAVKTDWRKRCALDFADEARAVSLVSNSGALLFPRDRARDISDYVCAVDSYKTKVYDSAEPLFGSSGIDAVLLQVEL